ncbi:MAG: cyclase family protein [Dehalococcoidales bacterium]|nr:cyclase family protein [Dehalococcoidales bacterium]
MKVIDLTMALYEEMASGYSHPAFKSHPIWPQPFKKEMTGGTTSGSQFHVYTAFCEAGTRILLPGYRQEYREADKARLHTVDLNRLVLRDTVVLDVPKGAEEFIDPEEIEAAFKKAPVQKGDALLVRTGWGDNDRYIKMGLDYKEKGPHYTGEAASKLKELMLQNGSDIFLYDCCDMNGTDKRTGRSHSAFGAICSPGIIGVGGVVNCGAITKPRVKLIALPLKARDAWFAPCSAIAIEE